MATYYDIKGQQVQNLASDPDPVVEGQVWYNTTSNTAKVASYVPTASWASGGAMNTARRQVGGFGHTQNTAVCVCGQNPPALSLTEEYNGSSWSEVNNSPQGRIKPFANGSLTAGLLGGGESGPSSLNTAVEYDGTNWAGGTTIPQNINGGTSVGTQTSALLCVGSPPPNTAVLYYDGSSWTAGPAATPVKMSASSGCGTSQTSALIFGAASPTPDTTTLEWDGSSWTAGGALNTGRNNGASSSGSPATDALYFAGVTPSVTNATEKYDGSSWANQPTMAQARRGIGGAGTTSSASAFGGYNGSDLASTEEFTGAGVSVKTITAS